MLGYINIFSKNKQVTPNLFPLTRPDERAVALVPNQGAVDIRIALSLHLRYMFIFLVSLVTLILDFLTCFYRVHICWSHFKY